VVPSAGSDDRRLTRKVFGVLVMGALVGSLAVLPYTITLRGLPPALPIPLWLLLVIGTVQNLLLFAGVTALGLWLGGKGGLATGETLRPEHPLRESDACGGWNITGPREAPGGLRFSAHRIELDGGDG